MAAAQDGDCAAYERLLREILPFVRALAARQHRAPDRIEDVVQEVLLTIHSIRHTYDPSRPFGPWLAAIVRRRSIDLLRRQGRIEAVETSAPEAYVTFSAPDADRQADRDAKTTLGRAVACLPPGLRQALELVKLRELSLTDDSRLSGSSVGALKINVHRAMKAPRTRLNGE